MNNEKIECIVCPKCGREYLPAEVYYPNQFLGRPRDINKLNNGKIESFDGQTMNLEETFVCDGCNTAFKAIATVKFRTVELKKYDFSKSYVTSLFEDTFTLSEDLAHQ